MYRLRCTVLCLFLMTIFLTYYIYTLIEDAGGFRKVSVTSPGPCYEIKGIIGAEDIDIDNKLNLAFISSYDRRKERGGGISTYGFSDRRIETYTFSDELGGDFYPHGLDLFIDDKEQRFLFVVNHRKDNDTIEVFKYLGGNLSHIDTLKHDTFKNINDIVVTSSTSFYFTVDHRFSSGLAQSMENYLRIPGGSVNYFNKGDVVQVDGDILFANGISLSTDSKKLYVASMLGKSILVYEQLEGNSTMVFRESIPLDFGPDNIHVGEDGYMWIAGHPDLIALDRYRQNNVNKSPSYVYGWQTENRDAMPEAVFSDVGDRLSASSVAVPLGDKLLIGSVYDDHILQCELGNQL
jgi:arylesterase/paraoxonase